CFVMVGRDGVEVMLSSAAGPGHVRPNRAKHPEAEWDAYVRVSGVDPLCAEFKAKGARILRGPEVTFYEMREFEVEDDSGYVLCFGEDVGEAARRRRAEALVKAITSARTSTLTIPQEGGSAMKKNGVKAVPEGRHTATPALIIRGAAEAIEFYKT